MHSASKRAEPAIGAVEREIRGRVALDWMPSQSARRAAYEGALAMEPPQSAQTNVDAIASAAVTARMQESLGLDWFRISSPECEYDPTMCDAAARQRGTGVHLWLSRARTNDALCERLAGYEHREDWERSCHERSAQLGHMLRTFSEGSSVVYSPSHAVRRGDAARSA